MFPDIGWGKSLCGTKWLMSKCEKHESRTEVGTQCGSFFVCICISGSEYRWSST